MKKHLPPTIHHLSGYSVVDLVAAIAVAVLLSSLLIPAIQQSRESARRSACVNNLKNIGLAFHNYHDTHSMFPPGAYESALAKAERSGKEVDLTKYSNAPAWVFVLPYLDQAPLYTLWDWRTPSGTAGIENPPDNKWRRNLKIATTQIETFICPSDTGPSNYKYRGNDPLYRVSPKAELQPALTNYILGSGVASETSTTCDLTEEIECTIRRNGEIVRVNGLGMFCNNNSRTISDVSDGTSNTIFAGESVRIKTKPEYAPLWGATKMAGLYGRVDPSGQPDDIKNCLFKINQKAILCDTAQPDRPYQWTWSSAHTNGANFVFADGKVSFISETICETYDSWIVFCTMNFISDEGGNIGF